MRRALATPLPALLALLTACAAGDPQEAAPITEGGVPPGAETLTVAGGCFWCVESDFEALDGVHEVVSGYAGGESANPTYKSHVEEGHREVARVFYDPEVQDYAGLVRLFLRSVDVTDAGGQFCDRGHSYTTAVFYETEAERAVAERLIAEAEAEIGQPVATAVEAEAPFTPAEDYHQDYYEKNPVRYRAYRWNCGRDRRVAQVWGEAFHD